jgi:hypothetical protein
LPPAPGYERRPVFPDLVVPSRNAGQRAFLTTFVRLAEVHATDEDDALERAIRARRAYMASMAEYSARLRRARRLKEQT